MLAFLGPCDGGRRVGHSRAAKDNSVADQCMCTGGRRKDEARESVHHWRADGWSVGREGRGRGWSVCKGWIRVGKLQEHNTFP